MACFVLLLPMWFSSSLCFFSALSVILGDLSPMSNPAPFIYLTAFYPLGRLLSALAMGDSWSLGISVTLSRVWNRVDR